MTDSPSERAAVYVTLALLCAVVATLRGRESPLAWVLVVAAIGWLIKSAFAFVGR